MAIIIKINYNKQCLLSNPGIQKRSTKIQCSLNWDKGQRSNQDKFPLTFIIIPLASKVSSLMRKYWQSKRLCSSNSRPKDGNCASSRYSIIPILLTCRLLWPHRKSPIDMTQNRTSAKVSPTKTSS